MAIDSCVNSIDNGEEVHVINTDFEIIFDKVTHKRLLFTLKQYVINPLYINQIEQCLSNRKHGVKINNEYSEWQNVTNVHTDQHLNKYTIKDKTLN